ncbi:DUF1963 domain-containing protein [Lentzea sp. JNUCC 0626]|uniref:DUF1963 domain-containing protein n=1 Tax=Lentzea sp. JNUCC 0626 TaxID=3367513 RepID=UPI00374905DC
MDRYEQFRSAAVDRGIPEDEVGRFTEHLRFAVWAWPAEGGEEIAGRMGGLPRLPIGVDWPGGDFPLPFIGSVDCAALPRAEGLDLPADGSLLFFLHHEEDMEEHPSTDYARVLHIPAGTQTQDAAPPPDHDSRTFFCESIPFLVPEQRITARVLPELPDWIVDRRVQFEAETVQQLFDELKHVDQLCELVGELWPEGNPRHRSTFRLGGYCRNVGSSDAPHSQMSFDSVQEQQANSGLSNDERWRLQREEEQRLVGEWLPLAQFPTQSDVYYGCFLIKAEDLASKGFDRMRSFTMFTE